LLAGEQARVTRLFLPSLGEVELLQARYVRHRFAPHWHDELAVGVVEAGALRTRVGRGEAVVPAGSLLVLNPGEIHTGEPSGRDGFSYRMVYLDALRLDPGTRGGEAGDTGSLAFATPVIEDRWLAGALLDAHRALTAPDGGRAEAEGALVDVLWRLCERYSARTRVERRVRGDTRLVRAIRSHLEEHHARVVTLAELAALTGRSAFHMSRTFRLAVGVPPYAYLALVRVRRARELLRAGVPVSVVTHATGFADQSHFIRQFKRVVGVPPGQYAREVSTGTAGRSRYRAFEPPSHVAAPGGGSASERPLRVSA
jgi:AraC-like DNA-binding protein